MPKVNNKALDMGKILPIKNYLLLVPLLFTLIACSVGNNSSADKPDNYSFNNLITHNEFYTPPPPGRCPLIPDSVIDHNPNRQLPEAKCTLDNNSPSQVAYGCNVDMNNPNNLGNRLAKSVIGVAKVESDNYYYTACTGTIIKSNWILTAAHCVANHKNDDTKGRFKSVIQYLVAVPWQEAYNGVPTRFNNESINIVKFPVKAIYIPYHYAYFDESSIPPYTGYLKDDFALLELESSLPNDYQPIIIESAAPNLALDTQLWSAGYGMNESQKQDGQLHYRQIYSYSRTYNIESNIWHPESGIFLPGPSKRNGTDYGMLYTTGSIPKYTESQAPSAWSFLGPGDSGGPILYYNQNTQKFSILATLTGGLYCDYAGFYAPLPYSFDQNTAMTESRYALIQQIINKTADRTDVRCISKNNTCFPKAVYVLNNISNSITAYSIDQNNNLHYMNEVNTGINPQAFTFDASHSYILVANSGNAMGQGSISVFKIKSNGALIANTNPEEHFNSNAKLIYIAADNNHDETNKNIYIATHNPGINGSSITRLVIDHDAGTLLSAQNINESNISINKIKFANNQLIAFDQLNNKISFYESQSLNPEPITTEGLSQPTDIMSYWVTNFGNHLITNYSKPNDRYYSHGEGPNQIIGLEIGAIQDFVYVTNLMSNNIAIFYWDDDDDSLTFESTVPTGNRPINMTISDSQLFVVNQLDNTLWRYNILSDGTLESQQSIATGSDPIAVLAN